MISIISAEQRLSSESVRYWKKNIIANLKIGVEMEFECTNGVDNDDLIRSLRNKLNPSGSFTFSGKGVYQITGDGSLRNGVELKTSGRRLDFINLYVQYKSYYDLIGSKGTITERCGLHNHVLMDYRNEEITSLETPMPGVIFKNFMQLLRRYAPELVWLTSTMKDSSSFTRYEGFCKADSMYSFTPASRNAEEYARAITNNGNGNGRYKFCNTIPFRANGDDITQLHFELRFPDGSLYPAQIAAQNILYGALLVKATELAEIGLIDTGTSDEWAETKRLYEEIRRGDGYQSNRLTPPLNETDLELVNKGSISMLKFLKSAIAQYDVKAYRTLLILSSQPISIMRRTMSDEQINNSFHDLISGMYTLDTDKFDAIISSIHLMNTVGALSTRQWAFHAAPKLGKTLLEVQKEIEELSLIKPLEFDIELGTYVFK